MSTATATRRGRKTDPMAELRLAEKQLEEAEADRARLGEEAEKYATAIRVAQAELGHIARTDASQFDAAGRPRPKTKAASLKRELDVAGSSNWHEILTGADQRVSELQAQVRRLVDQYAVELARAEFRAAEDELAELDEPAKKIIAIIDRLKAHEGRLIQIAASASGRIDGRDVSWDPRLNDLRELLEQQADLKPPRSVTLTPLVGEEPRIRRSRAGGWIEHWGADDLGEQPERVEPRR